MDHNYNAKLIECAALEETTVHDQACMHAASNRQCASNFTHEHHMTMVAYNNAVETIRALEYDRKREWEILKITFFLLETLYTHPLRRLRRAVPHHREPPRADRARDSVLPCCGGVAHCELDH